MCKTAPLFVYKQLLTWFINFAKSPMMSSASWAKN